MPDRYDLPIVNTKSYAYQLTQAEFDEPTHSPGSGGSPWHLGARLESRFGADGRLLSAYELVP